MSHPSSNPEHLHSERQRRKRAVEHVEGRLVLLRAELAAARQRCARWSTVVGLRETFWARAQHRGRRALGSEWQSLKHEAANGAELEREQIMLLARKLDELEAIAHCARSDLEDLERPVLPGSAR